MAAHLHRQRRNQCFMTTEKSCQVMCVWGWWLGEKRAGQYVGSNVLLSSLRKWAALRRQLIILANGLNSVVMPVNPPPPAHPPPHLPPFTQHTPAAWPPAPSPVHPPGPEPRVHAPCPTQGASGSAQGSQTCGRWGVGGGRWGGGGCTEYTT